MFDLLVGGPVIDKGVLLGPANGLNELSLIDQFLEDLGHPPTVEPIAVSGVLSQIFQDQVPQPNHPRVDTGVGTMAALCEEFTYFSTL